MDSKGIVIQGLDVIDVLTFTQKKNKKFQAVFLNDLEELFNPQKILDFLGVSKNSPEGIEIEKFYRNEFYNIRKLYLDAQNNYTRSILRAIFGDVEDKFE